MSSQRGSRRPFNSEGLEAGFDQDIQNAASSKGAFGIFVGLPKVEWLKLVDGVDYSFRFLSWYAKDDEKKPAWYLKQEVHKYVGPQGNARDYACRMNVGDPSCICCREIPDTKAGSRYYYNILVREGRNTEWKHYLLQASFSVHNEFVKAGIKTNPDSGEKIHTYFMSPDKGCTVGFTGLETRKGSAKWIAPSAIGFGTPSTISQEDLDKAIDLHSFVHVFSNEELLGAIDGNHPIIKKEVEGGVVQSSQNNDRELIQAQENTKVVDHSVQQELLHTRSIEEPVYRNVVKETSTNEVAQNIKICSMGLVFGDPAICGKQVLCDKCPDSEYKECANQAGTK